MIVWRCTGISTIAFVQTFLSLLGWSGQIGFAQKANPTKKKSTHKLFIVHQARVVNLVTMALLPLLMHRHLCHCCDGVIAIVDVQASLPLLSYRCCPCCLSSSWHCCPHHDGVIAINMQASLPLLQWQLLLLSQWRCCCRQCRGVSAIVKLA
jgi:hypothetical protein